MQNTPFAVAIDGPVGVGKSTVARRLAAHLGITYIDSGAMYRAVALYNQRLGNSAQNEADIVAGLPDIHIRLTPDSTVFLNGEDVTHAIRSQTLAEYTSTIAVYAPVREKLTAQQREMAAHASIVMDGRDIGSHVLPHARVKIYLDATPEVRAQRRLAELQAKGIQTDHAQVLAETLKRDHRDKTRQHAPLVRTPDAHYIDASTLDIDGTFQAILQFMPRKG